MVGALRTFRFAVIIALIVGGPIADACSCVGRGTVEEAMGSSHLVFLGTVERIDDRRAGLRWAWLRVRELFGMEPSFSVADEHGYKVTFRASTIWKGPAERTVSVFTGRGGGDCGYKFEIGKTYLVYSSCGDYCYTGICARTTKEAWATKDLAFLAKLPTVALSD